jgi:DNA adenine methylase
MSYDGGKGRAGVYQWVINHIPPHRVYVELCLGDGAILRAKRPAESSIAVEIDRAVIAQRWSGLEVPNLTIYCEDVLFFLSAHPWQGDEFVYCDPPYLLHTRSYKKPMYRYEMADVDHYQLLQLLKGLPCHVALSGYDSAMYARELAGWQRDSLQTTKRSGERAVECLWMNYPAPLELHDYRFLGGTFRERERIKRKRARWRGRLQQMPLLERHALLAAIEDLRDSARAGIATTDEGIGEGCSIAVSDEGAGLLEHRQF